MLESHTAFSYINGMVIDDPHNLLTMMKRSDYESAMPYTAFYWGKAFSVSNMSPWKWEMDDMRK